MDISKVRQWYMQGKRFAGQSCKIHLNGCYFSKANPVIPKLMASNVTYLWKAIVLNKEGFFFVFLINSVPVRNKITTSLCGGSRITRHWGETDIRSTRKLPIILVLSFSSLFLAIFSIPLSVSYFHLAFSLVLFPLLPIIYPRAFLPCFISLCSLSISPPPPADTLPHAQS